MPHTGQATKVLPAPKKEAATKIENPEAFASEPTKTKAVHALPMSEANMDSLSAKHRAEQAAKMDPKQKAVLEQHIKNTNLGLAYKNTKAVGSNGKLDSYVNKMGKDQLKSFSLGDRLKFKTNIAAGRISTMAAKFKSNLLGQSQKTPGPASSGAKPDINNASKEFGGNDNVTKPEGLKPMKPKVQSNASMPGVNTAMAKSINDLLKSTIESNDIKKASSNPFKGKKADTTPPDPRGWTVKGSGSPHASSQGYSGPSSSPSSAPKGYSVKVTGAKPGYSGYKPPKEPKAPKPPKAESTNPVKEKNIVSERQIGTPPPMPKDAAADAAPKAAPMTTTGSIGVKNKMGDHSDSAHHGILATLGKLIQPHTTPVISKIAQLAREKAQK